MAGRFLLAYFGLGSLTPLPIHFFQAIRVQAQAPANQIYSTPFPDLRRSPP